MRHVLRTATLLAVPLLLWELLSRFGPWPRWLFPGPPAVAASIGHLAADGRLGAATARSLTRLAQGYGVSAAIGVPLGIAMARSRLVQQALRPAVLGLQALPSICWLPLAMLWFGLSETGDPLRGRDGLAARGRHRDRGRRRRGRPGAAPRRRHARDPRPALPRSGVLLPAALPGILTGLKLGWSFAWRALMAGELLFVAGGLGQLLSPGRELLDAAQVMGVMVSIVAIGVAVDQVLVPPPRGPRPPPLGTRRG